MTKDEALTLALEALEKKAGSWGVGQESLNSAAITALRDGLAQPEQEPVAGQPLPCPFCGANAGLTMTDGSTYRWGYAYCSNCGASAGEVRRAYPDDGKWYADVIHNWNQRATPSRREWVGLTNEEIEQACVPLGAAMLSFTEVARVIEAKLKEKNT